MPSVLVLGGTGMLGSMIVDQIGGVEGLEVAVTTRTGAPSTPAAAHLKHLAFDALNDDPSALLRKLPAETWIVNAIGTIKPYINESDRASRVQALRVNALFPHDLAAGAEETGNRVIQIATDCVYSGLVGAYDENALHDALDIYGKTKSLGEVPSPAVMHLRVSIIGPELSAHVSLLDWFRGLPTGAAVTGFDNHLWNGVTTMQYARLVLGAITNDRFTPGMAHVVPSKVVTKAEMLHLFSEAFNRPDVQISVAPAKQAVDRTLSTLAPADNLQRWLDAGYTAAPTVGEMIAELAASGLKAL